MMGGYNREISIRKARRKRRIAHMYVLFSQTGWYDNLHQYSKNKIHCSCPMCTRKTNNKGKNRLKHGNYYPSKDWKHSDALKILDMEQEMKEYLDGSQV